MNFKRNVILSLTMAVCCLGSANFGRYFGAFDGLLWSSVLCVLGGVVISRWVLKL